MSGRRKFLALVSLAALSILMFLAQYYFRAYDDNRLTSWEPVFRFADFRKVFFLLCLGMAAAWPLSRILAGKRYRPLLLFVFAYGAGMLFWNEPELILDASRYFTQAKHLELSGPVFFLREWGREIFAWTDMPVVPFIFGSIFRLFGEDRIYIQIFTTFCFAMSAVLTFLIGSRLWDEETGYTAGMLLLGIPYLFSQVPLMLVDVPLMFLLLLSVYAFILALQRGGLMIPLAALSLCITFFAKYSAGLMLTVTGVLFVVSVLRASVPAGTEASAQQRAVRGLLVFLLSGAAIGLIGGLKAGVFAAQLALLRDYQGPGLRRWGETFLSTFLFQVHPGVTLAALFSVWAAFRKWDPKYLVVCWLPLLVIATQLMRIRYILPVFPLFCLMAGYGLMQLRQAGLRRYIVSGVVLSSVVVAVFAYRPFLNVISSVNLKNAGELLETVSGHEAEVFTVYAEDAAAGPSVVVPLLDLFTRKGLVYRDGTHGKGQDTAPRDLKSGEILISPLRFTWEYRNPRYYAQGGRISGDAQKGPAVVITGRRDEALPDQLDALTKTYRNMRTFEKDEKEFEFKTFVRVYYN